MRLLISLAVLSLAAGLNPAIEWSSAAQAPASGTVSGNAAAPQLTYEDAQQLAAKGRLDEALNILNQLTAQTPVPDGAERLRAMIYYQQENLQKAADGFARAIAQDASDRESVEMEGVALYRLGHAAEALPYLEKANTAVEHANVEPQYALGLCYLSLARYDDARHAFAAQYGFGGDSAEAYLLAGRLFLRHEYRDQAAEHAQKALQLNPALPRAHELLGEVALSLDNVSGAIQEFDAERKINPLDGEVYDRLGDAYVRAGRYADAQQALNRAVLLEPTSTGPYILLGQTLLRQGKPVQALQYLIRAEKMDPSNYLTHNLLGQAYKATGQLDAANREFRLVVEIQHPDETNHIQSQK